MAEHYWHLFGAPARRKEAGPNAEPEVWAQVIISDVPIPPDAVGRDDGLRVDKRVVELDEFGYVATLVYRGSWDHAPSDLEQQLVVPFEWQDEDLLNEEAS